MGVNAIVLAPGHSSKAMPPICRWSLLPPGQPSAGPPLEIKREIAEEGMKAQAFLIDALCESDHRVEDQGWCEFECWVEVIIQRNLYSG